MKRFDFLSPAKLNLRLEVLGRRDDGYHEIRSIIQRISLCDRIRIILEGEGISLRAFNQQLPEGPDNIAWRAAELLLQEAKLKAGVHIELWKNIPVAAGLGGGSSNAAAVLIGLNRLLGLDYSIEELMMMGTRLGADVPFFLFDSPAIAEGIGERLEKISMHFKPWYVLISPKIEVSTEWAYQNINLKLTRSRFQFNIPRFLERLEDLCNLLHNDLERVTEGKYPEIVEIKKALLKLGAKGALMTGSGPTVFGVFEDETSARRAHDLLRSNSGWRTFFAWGM